MTFLGLPLLDLAAIVLYFAGMIVIGLLCSRRNKEEEDYFLGGRRFGKFIQTFAAFGQGTSSETAIGTVRTVYSGGASGVWSGLIYLFATPVYWVISPWYRRMRVLTLSDFFKERYGSRSLVIAYSIMAMFGAMNFIAGGIVGVNKAVIPLTPKTVEEMTVEERTEYDLGQRWNTLEQRDFASLAPEEADELATLREQRPRVIISHLNKEVLTFTVAIIIIAYGVMGGLSAAFITDTIQGLFIIALSLLLLPFAWAKLNLLNGSSGVGGAFSSLHGNLESWRFEFLGSPYAQEFTFFFILATCLAATINVAIQPNTLVALASAKNEHAARFGMVTGNFMKRVVTILWAVTGLFLFALYAHEIRDGNLIWGYATRDLLGSLGLGLVGLMIACLLSALMSTADAWMITASGILTNNVYKPFNPNRSPKHYVIVGGIFGAATIIGGCLIALYFDDIFDLIKMLWSFFLSFAAVFWLGMVWRRPGKTAAWISVGATALIFLALPIFLPMLAPQLRSDASTLLKTPDQVMTRSYQASQADVEARQLEIEALQAQGAAELPPSIRVNQTFEKVISQPGQSLFWEKGIVDGQGHGRLFVDLYLLQQLGVDLREMEFGNAKALSMGLNVLLPFLIFLIAGSLLPAHKDERAARFFITMRVRVAGDSAEDQARLERAYADPESTECARLFPRSNWEFRRWNREDWMGLLVSAGLVVVIFLGFAGILRIGAG
jgi:SSS family solute:Na+ symporter